VLSSCGAPCRAPGSWLLAPPARFVRRHEPTTSVRRLRSVDCSGNYDQHSNQLSCSQFLRHMSLFSLRLFVSQRFLSHCLLATKLAAARLERLRTDARCYIVSSDGTFTTSYASPANSLHCTCYFSFVLMV